MKPKIFEAIAPDGTPLYRTSTSRTYSHAVLEHSGEAWRLVSAAGSGQLGQKELEARRRQNRFWLDFATDPERKRRLAAVNFVLVPLQLVERKRNLKAEARAAAKIADRIDGYDRDDLGESPDC